MRRMRDKIATNSVDFFIGFYYRKQRIFINIDFSQEDKFDFHSQGNSIIIVFSMILKLVASVSIISLVGVHAFGLDGSPGTTVPENLPHTSSLSADSAGMDPEVRRIYLSMIQPEQIPLVTDSGRFIVSSVESYDVGAAGISGCSFIARKNIISLTTAFGAPHSWMAQGDANDLIRFGRHNRTLTSFSNKKLIIEALNARKDTFVETVFDVYRHVPNRTYALQGHRVAVFLGEDEKWYILDTIDGQKTRTPQLFETYLANDVDNAEWFVRFP